MTTLDEQLARYAAYHRNGWNRFLHFLGVPLITFSILIPMAWLRWRVGGFELTGAAVFAIAVLAWYFMLDATLAAVTALAIAVLLYLADRVAQLPLATGLWLFAASFVGGWIFQLVGHAIEGRRPALVDNLQQIFVAPIFLVAEACFAVGLKRDVQTRMAARRRAAAD